MGAFIEEISKMHKDDIEDTKDLFKYEDGTHGKLSKLQVNLLVFSKINWKIFIYLLSYFLKFLSDWLIK